MARRTRLHIGFAGLLSVLFILLQGISVAHALQHGEKSHLHDGKECTISVFQDRQDDLLPTLDVCGPVPTMAHASATIDPTLHARVPVIGLAQPRAPPAIR